MKAVMTGHHYNRSVHAHKLMYEALQLLRWMSFLHSLSEEDQNLVKLEMMKLSETEASDKWIEIVAAQATQVIGEPMDFVTSREGCHCQGMSRHGWKR